MVNLALFQLHLDFFEPPGLGAREPIFGLFVFNFSLGPQRPNLPWSLGWVSLCWQRCPSSRVPSWIPGASHCAPRLAASICFMAPSRNSWICCPQLPCHLCKNGTHSTSFCFTTGRTPRIATWNSCQFRNLTPTPKIYESIFCVYSLTAVIVFE